MSLQNNFKGGKKGRGSARWEEEEEEARRPLLVAGAGVGVGATATSKCSTARKWGGCGKDSFLPSSLCDDSNEEETDPRSSAVNVIDNPYAAIPSATMSSHSSALSREGSRGGEVRGVAKKPSVGAKKRGSKIAVLESLPRAIPARMTVS